MSTLVLSPDTGTAAPSRAATPPFVRKPRVWTPFVALLVALIGAPVLSSIAYEAAYGLVHARGVAQGLNADQTYEQYVGLMDGTFLGFVIGLLATQLPMALVVLFAAAQSREPLKQRLGLERPAMPRLGWIAAPFAALGDLLLTAVLAGIVVSMIGVVTPPGAPPVMNPTLAVGVAVAVLTALVPAFCEELLFRGYMQRRLLQRWSPAVAITVQGGLFALLHCDSLLHILAVLPGGIFYGVLAYRTRSIWPGVLLHFLNNAYAAGLGALDGAAMESAAAAYASVAALLVGVLLGGPSVLYLMFGRLQQPKARPAGIAIDEPLAGAAEFPLSTVSERDAAALPKPLVPAAAGAPHRSADAPPLTTLSA
jgi:membrane protease YdiL (CAAX protease family)